MHYVGNNNSDTYTKQSERYFHALKDLVSNVSTIR